MKDIIKKYSNDDITVVWQPAKCIHSTKCFKGMLHVFNPKERPWIKLENAKTEEIISQIKNCPSGALSYYENNEKNVETITTAETIIEPMPNGPLLVYGNINVKSGENTIKQSNKVTAFCRCGQSNNKPYCDGTHAKINFVG